MGFEWLSPDSLSFYVNIAKLAVSGLEIGVQERPIGDVNVDGAPDEGLQYDSANPVTLTASMEEDWNAAWQWQRSADGNKWDDITGATNTTYQIAQADDGNQIRVIATTVHGKAASDAMQVGAVLILRGAAVDQKLKAWVLNTDLNTVKFEWEKLPRGADSKEESNWKTFGEASSTKGASTYTPSLTDCGATFRVLATYKETKQTLAREYLVPDVAVTASLYKLDDTGEKVVVSANACVGDELYIQEGTGGAPARFAYSWYQTGTPDVSLSNQRSYIVTPDCVGKAIRAQGQYKSTNDAKYPETPATSSAITILAPSVAITPTTAKVGTELTAVVNNVKEKAADSGKGVSVQYQWYNTTSSSVALADTKTYTPNEIGQYQVKITLHDNANSGAQVGEYTSATITVSAT